MQSLQRLTKVLLPLLFLLLTVKGSKLAYLMVEALAFTMLNSNVWNIGFSITILMAVVYLFCSGLEVFKHQKDSILCLTSAVILIVVTSINLWASLKYADTAVYSSYSAFYLTALLFLYSATYKGQRRTTTNN